ncbi:MAG TPA: RNA methyltransferase [Bacteroidales bacterium]|nr:RNA methyltransferase [Bacteroidales bacterium]
MKKLSMEDLDRLSVQDFENVEKMPVVVVLDNIRSQHNIGSVFRTSDAFRVEAIHLCGITATPPHREIHKTALGATESVKWEYYSETSVSVQRLIEAGYRIVVIEQTDASISPGELKFDGQQKTALVFGNEVKGVGQAIIDMAETCVEIPQMGTKHSLNVSVSAGIVIWSLFTRMHWQT